MSLISVENLIEGALQDADSKGLKVLKLRLNPDLIRAVAYTAHRPAHVFPLTKLPFRAELKPPIPIQNAPSEAPKNAPDLLEMFTFFLSNIELSPDHELSYTDKEFGFKFETDPPT